MFLLYMIAFTQMQFQILPNINSWQNPGYDYRGGSHHYNLNPITRSELYIVPIKKELWTCDVSHFYINKSVPCSFNNGSVMKCSVSPGGNCPAPRLI